MDTIYKKSKAENEVNSGDIIASQNRRNSGRDVMSGYSPKQKPRLSNPESFDAAQRINRNLQRINKKYIASPGLPAQSISSKRKSTKSGAKDSISADKRISRVNTASKKAVRIPAVTANPAISRKKIGGMPAVHVSIVTKKSALKKPLPIALISFSIIITAVFMYMLSLYVQIDNYTNSISELKASIADLKEEETLLEVRLESKYNLDMVEKIATEQYGMIRADQLPKKYISLVGEDVIEITRPKDDSGINVLLSGFQSSIKDILE